MENKRIFREKSLQKISSPDQLNDYMKATSPSVWLLLSAVLILLSGALVWSVFGRMETVVGGVALSENGSAICYVDEATIQKLAPGMPVDLGGYSATVSSVITSAEKLTGDEGAYLLRVAGLSEGTPVYRALLTTNAPDGVYHAAIKVESISPLSFIIN